MSSPCHCPTTCHGCFVFSHCAGRQGGANTSTSALQKLRLGSKTINLDLSPNAFKHELYSASSSSLSEFAFDALVTHRARVKSAEKEDKGTAGADAALASLKSNLASFAQEKQANSVAISNSVQATPKNRFEAARTQKQAGRSLLSGAQSGGRGPSVGAAGTPNVRAPTSQPLNDDQAKSKAMRVAVIHLMAMRPASLEDIASKTRIQKEDLEPILRKVGQERDGRWELVNRSYKELDVWNCKYPSQENRQAAIDNAIKAFDRLRVAKEDKVWQMLLPQEERGKGKVLSKLHLSAPQGAAGNFTPGVAGSSPQPSVQGSQPASSVGTPQLGASTKTAASKKAADITKRLLSKDPKKAREQEEAKMKKRKEREATASDAEGKKAAKKQATTAAKGPPAKKIKSAEIVHSSEDEDDEPGEVKEKAPPSKTKPSSPKAAAKTAPSKPTNTKVSSSDSSDVPVKQAKAIEKPPVTKKRDALTTKPEASPTTKPAKPAHVAAGKTTPRANGLTAPSNKTRPALSPQKPDSKPHVPSPLGAARPRVASDVSERSAIGVQRTKHAGGDTGTQKGLGTSHGNARGRQDTVTSATSSSSIGPEAKSANESSQEKARRPAAKPAGAQKPAATQPSASSKNEKDRAPKRKRDDGLDNDNDTVKQPEAKKHRKTDSASSQNQDNDSSASSTTTATGPSTAKTSPEETTVFDSGSSDAASSENAMSFRQAVSMAQNFKTYYPSYEELWERLAAMQRKGESLPQGEVERLWVMQNRLVEMKRDIQDASRVGREASGGG